MGLLFCQLWFAFFGLQVVRWNFVGFPLAVSLFTAVNLISLFAARSRCLSTGRLFVTKESTLGFFDTELLQIDRLEMHGFQSLLPSNQEQVRQIFRWVVDFNKTLS